MHGLTYAELAVEHDRALAEIDRLRAALEKIANWKALATTDMTVIERVAQAIGQHTSFDPEWNMRMARAAIAAMHEPPALEEN